LSAPRRDVVPDAVLHGAQARTGSAASIAACKRYDVVVCVRPGDADNPHPAARWPKKCAASRASACRPSLTVARGTEQPRAAALGDD
jgi:hypothetical protein